MKIIRHCNHFFIKENHHVKVAFPPFHKHQHSFMKLLKEEDNNIFDRNTSYEKVIFYLETPHYASQIISINFMLSHQLINTNRDKLLQPKLLKNKLTRKLLATILKKLQLTVTKIFIFVTIIML